MRPKVRWLRRLAASAAADRLRPTWWKARTAWMLLRRSPHRTATATLLGRLWWRERRGGEERLELLRFRDGADVLEMWVTQLTDLHIVREAFGDHVYPVPDGVHPRTILDLGANIGASVLWFHRRFPDAEIHAVEPDRRSLAKLERNVGGLPGVTVHHAAVAGEGGPRTFYEARQSWSSSLRADVAAGGHATTVTALTLPMLLRERVGRERVDLLKMDVEGAEWELLQRLRLAELADVVAGELHPSRLGEAAERDALSHGLAGFDVSYQREDERYGNFVAVSAGSRGA